MNIPNSKELDELIKICRKGDQRAQRELFALCYPLSMNICRRYARDLEEAKSLVNEGMLKVFRQLHQYSNELSFGGWVRRIMVNTAIDQYRKNKRQQDQIIDHNNLDGNTSCSEEILNRMSADEILSLVQQLPPAYRMVFSLYAVEEYTHKDIAKKLGISEGTSKSNYAKAKAKLQQAMASFYHKQHLNNGEAR